MIYQDKLRKIQKVELQILLYFDCFCKKHNIKYFLGGGTLLGAVRHKGFIPWDDDIDVMMTWSEYKRLCKMWEQNNNDKDFFFQTSFSDISYHDHMAKLRLKNTIYATRNNLKFPDMEKGFFIDIFAHTKTPTNKYIHKLHVFATILCRSMVYHKWMNTPMQYYGKHKIVCKLVSLVIKFIPISVLEGLRDYIITFFESFTTFQYLYDGYGEHITHGFFCQDILKESVLMPFEGYLFPVPRRYDEYLRFSYGDNYMELPPRNQRIPHHDIVKLDFGKWGK